ncbi:hypothetical protein [Pseudonocardia endophytica]|uniref:ARB-07466-like C-terminal domain-containing protein n=1 Tax=Pseudonocardia endophytica TaxID=401976 RepID=A0A4R1HEV0_PSEEN|nr:hypothetical protein [Pseudonocardia endophytica]TCK20644.1 hypothetical protein EV378_4605 [Pseudonocardia endophytica]
MSRHRRPALDTRTGLRNVATAAAAASGVLAVVTPVAGLTDDSDAAPETTGAFRLASEASAAEASTEDRGPVLAGADDVVRSSGLLAATAAAGQGQERLVRDAAARAAAASAPSAAPATTERNAPKAGSCDLDTSGLGGVKSWVADAAQFLGCAFGQPDMLGVGSRGNASDHPGGKALDLMTTDEARGDAIAECALANADELGVTYVIWNQRMNTGGGWESMEDRGGDTANHKDHVHISFGGSGGSGTPDLGRCA